MDCEPVELKVVSTADAVAVIPLLYAKNIDGSFLIVANIPLLTFVLV